ncbi:MAG: hypothetical protein CSB24_07385 [Deltaproteobacteria bacterium]|nr:MAG: hypothetical protein CSB24_07385 [Deltaproteobacteria bacterium]
MKELILPERIIRAVEGIYDQLERLYAEAAEKMDFGCAGCPDNCCDSWFLHHTYLEWAYLHIGLKRLPLEKQAALVMRSMNYREEAKRAEAAGSRPQIMCPLNEDGLCIVYKHRLLVCRTHGVPASITRPDGRVMNFPGCFRCQELVTQKYENAAEAPLVERTPFLRELALLENELLENNRNRFPRVKMTIADMIAEGPPRLNLRRE